MIVREYYQNINCHNTRNYFERWYADVWQRRIGKRNAPPGVLQPILVEELEKVNATITEKDKGYRFVVHYHNDADYTAFVLRWS